ncbi:acetolactate decarboxylase [Dyadobacter chenhuakuii]|uniref:Alpha-acetolactate decarboxylase n=1 Tax=Dyadobacter chenhuakuii TaxID=2909339 RepID=A0A9X1Q8U4_9BACT|nr:acetolactate decarboxylase [Dyadobacter chenhuakuii]MCF2496746.1 acetolactate decarboxylase [Dyadobacter chenhuakuii]
METSLSKQNIAPKVTLMRNRLVVCICLMLLQAVDLFAQSVVNNKITKIETLNRNNGIERGPAKPYLFQYGIANAFIEGLYEGHLSIDELKKHGDFGIGAPNLIDGELTIVDGIAYQSNAKGQTIEAPGQIKTPFAFVTTFKADTTLLLANVQNIDELFTRIESLLPNRNGIYALRIGGLFSKMRTRAFPAMVQKPYRPLAKLLDQQQFFELNGMDGAMIGFYMPGYLSGINITGLHFHFLSTDRTAGGHVVALTAQNLTIEITEVKSFLLETSETADFQKFQFIGGNSSGLQKIEKGGN